MVIYWVKTKFFKEKYRVLDVSTETVLEVNVEESEDSISSHIINFSPI